MARVPGSYYGSLPARAAELLGSWGQIQQQTNALSGLRWAGTPDYVADTNNAVNDGVLGKVSSGPSNKNGELFGLRGPAGGPRGGQGISPQVADGDLFALDRQRARQRGGQQQRQGHSGSGGAGKVLSLEREAAALKRSEAEAEASERKLQGLERSQAYRAQALKRQEALIENKIRAQAHAHTAAPAHSVAHAQQKSTAPAPQAAPAAEYVGASGEPAEVDAALVKAEAPAANGLRWADGMGTDISFINTLDFPKSMVNGVHNNPANIHNAEVNTHQADKASHHQLAAASAQHQFSPQPAAAAAGTVGSKEDSSSLAQRVASLVLGAIQPEIKRQESEIKSLQRATVSQSARTLQLSSSRAPDALRPSQAALLRAKGQQLSIKDYNMQGFFTHGNPYHSLAPENQEWQAGARKGSPCSTAGECNHGKYWLPWQDKRNEYAHHVVGGGGDEEWKRLGNDVLGRSFDDYVTPNDAYAHDMLTSGDERVDHFANMPPQSKENQVIMYGKSAEDFEHYRDREHMPGRGAFNGSEFRVGEDQLGASDDEVPVQLSSAPVPGPNPDHFSNWRPGSDLNMAMMNGVYWKDLKSAGLLDRWTPADEMYAKQTGIREMGHPLVDPLVETYNVVSGRGAKKYPDKVWTGTHEIIEDGKGTVGSDPDMKSAGL